MNNKDVTVKLGELDWTHLREQKNALLEMIWNDSDSILWGIIHIIDKIQDEAVDNGDFTEEEVFGKLTVD
jgi:hypothetical protein